MLVLLWSRQIIQVPEHATDAGQDFSRRLVDIWARHLISAASNYLLSSTFDSHASLSSPSLGKGKKKK